MKEMKTLTLNGEQYRITDALAARINDNASGPDSTWSGEKIAAGLQERKDETRQAMELAQAAGKLLNDSAIYEDKTWSSRKIIDTIAEYVGDSYSYHREVELEIKAANTRQDETLAEHGELLQAHTEQLKKNTYQLQLNQENINNLFDSIENRVGPVVQGLEASTKAHEQRLGEVEAAVNELFNRADNVVNDEYLSSGTTWSSNKLYGMFGEVESALDAILAMQNRLIGGDSV